MNRKTNIPFLCQKYSSLTKEDINKIIEVADSIDVVGDSLDCDIFIDIPSRQKDGAIVVYHVKPRIKSIYKHSPTGQRAEIGNEPGVWQTLQTGKVSKNIKAKTQEGRYITQNIYPIFNREKVIGTLIMERDISYNIMHFSMNHKANYDMSSTLILIKNLNDYLDDAILIFDHTGKLLTKNVKADILFHSLGFTEENEGKHFNELRLIDMTFEQFLQADNTQHEIKIGNFYFLMKKVMVPNGERKLAIILQDITQLKDKDAEISMKTVAIREIHHRIKNNLQTIASMLRLQSRRSESEEAKKILKDSLNRILSIAATHELLSKQLSDEINLIEVIDFVLKNLQASYTESDEIQLFFTFNEEFLIESDKATVIALIVNELVQNCYDHAFKGLEKGEIIVDVNKQNEIVTINVQDNGVGFRYTEEIEKSLGFSIVQSYVRDKLRGKLGITKREKGTDVFFRFTV
ncbi:hypothetical protein CHH80_17180 [Bacillus sp. 7504-2]|nr:hypothetical protein CHH80_17180 [Bacillus sp. 7504-2]